MNTDTCTGRATIDGEPLPRALVYSFDTGSNLIYDVTLTDSEGEYELPLQDAMSVFLKREYQYTDLQPPYGKHPLGR